MSKKLTIAKVDESIEKLNSIRKPRKFEETIELQILLKDYDPQRDKRFSGSLQLPFVPRPRLRICLIGDAAHIDELKKDNIGIDSATTDFLTKFNKDKKDIKKWAKKYHLLLCTDSLIKQVPKILGPVLNRINRFPQVVNKTSPLAGQVDAYRATIKFQLKKVLNLCVPIGNVTFKNEELRKNILQAINFLVSLTKKGWNNIKTIHVKSTMSKAVRLY